MDHCGLGALKATVLCVVLGWGVLGCSNRPGESVSSPSASPSIPTQITPSSTASSTNQPVPTTSIPPKSPSGSSASPSAATGPTPSPSTQPQPQTSATASASPSALPIAKQDTGKTYLSTILVSQQAEKLVSGRFSDDLPRLAPEVPLQNEEYQIEVRQADTSHAVVVAIAKRPGFASY
ncbi:MAG TPA: type IV pilin-like G/H family protein, partial [Stenomitos sp.]